MIGGKARDGKRKEKKIPQWQQRIEKSIGEWRKDLGRLEKLRKSGKLNDEEWKSWTRNTIFLRKDVFW